MTRCPVSLLVLLVLTSCGREEQAAPLARVEVTVDGEVVAQAALVQPGTRQCLPDLLAGPARDPTTWVMLEVHATDGRKLALHKPAQAHPNQDFCVYLTKDGHAGFGVYRRDDPALPARIRELRWQPAPFLEPVDRIDIRTTETPQEKAFGRLAAVVDGGEGIQITLEMLEGLGAIEAPELGAGQGGRVEKQEGVWPLRDVLGLVADPDTIESIRVVDLAGADQDLTVESLASAAQSMPVLKRSRRGDHHLRFLEGRRVVREIRSVVRIEIRTGARR